MINDWFKLTDINAANMSLEFFNISRLYVCKSINQCRPTCTVLYIVLQRGRDRAFVSRAYADICSCATNVTSHNPEKLKQSHLITHIHDAIFFFTIFIIFFCITWLWRLSIYWFIANISLITTTPQDLFYFIFVVWGHYGVFCYYKRPSYCQCLQHVQTSWEFLIKKLSMS